MQESVNFGRVVKIMGAYVSWVMGSGFATGQEILQFFTGFCYYSFAMIAINLVGFLLIGPTILEVGFQHRHQEGFVQTKFFCGKKLGKFYTLTISLSLFTGMIVLISGAGATLHEYYNVPHLAGALFIACAAYAAYIIGFQRFVKVVSLIGPLIIGFTILVGFLTVLRDYPGLSEVSQYTDLMENHRSTKFWWVSAFLYISYNLTGGSMYYAALGGTAASRKEAVYGGVLGSVVLMLAILLMNTAMLSNIGEAASLEIPTLFLAKKISFVLGAVFSITLILGIFATCSAMLWTVSERFVTQGTKKSWVFAAGLCLVAFVLGLLPFADLVGIIYPYIGYISLGYVACVVYYQLYGKKQRALSFVQEGSNRE